MDNSLHPTTPETITDHKGQVWTYAHSPFDTKFGRTYKMGQRSATLMAHHGGGPRRLMSVSGKVLAVLP